MVHSHSSRPKQETAISRRGAEAEKRQESG
jgi:hypothetical protein